MFIDEYKDFNFTEKNSGAFRNLLEYERVTIPDTDEPFSDTLLMGIGGGIGAEYLTYGMKSKGKAGFYFRLSYKPSKVSSANDWFIPRIASRVGLKIIVYETSSQKKFYTILSDSLKNDKPIIIFPSLGEMRIKYPLPYSALSLGSGLVPTYCGVVYGIDEETNRIFLRDKRLYPFSISLEELIEARTTKRHIAFIIESLGKVSNLEKAIRGGISDCCRELLYSKMRGVRVDAFQLWAERLANLKDKQGWLKFSHGQLYDNFMRIHGLVKYFLSSGGGLRSTYADFLDEASVIINNPKLRVVSLRYRKLSYKWAEFAKAVLPDSIQLFKEASQAVKKYNAFFLDHKESAIHQLKEKNDVIKSIRRKIIDSWPFSRNETIDLLEELSQQLFSIYNDEKEAILSLKSIID
ncbi:MAG: DUF4872 domain-containing protein [Promethearchaeota archaeon]